MLIREASYIGKVLKELPLLGISPLLNIGAGDRRKMKLLQPWIEREIFEPLARRGVRVTHHGFKLSQGIDIAADLMSNEFVKKAKKIRPKAIILANVLEHVKDRKKVARNVLASLPVGGYLIVSCPYRYPYHPDPIDTGFRPTAEELTSYFPNCAIISSKEFTDYAYWYYVSRSFLVLIGTIVMLFVPLGGFHQWIARPMHLAWLNKRFVATVVVLRKRSG